MTVDAETPEKRAGARCPICGKPVVKATRPFCSRGCANVDLLRWLGGRYVLAGGDEEIVGEGSADEP